MNPLYSCPPKKYNVIYADPPWKYDNARTGGSLKSGAADKYPVLTVAEIAALPVADIAEKTAVLFLWATVPLLPEAFQVLNAWGFKYKTMLTWRKIMSLGLGYWYRGQCEHLLLGVRGKVKPFRMQVCNFHESKAEKHSKKPEHFRYLINVSAAKSFENPRKLELFARENVQDWDAYGNEVENSILLQ